MEEKVKSKKWIIITILIIVIVALTVVGGYFGYKIWQDSQTTGTDWGDTYLDDLEGKISSGEYADTENGSFGFLQFEESKQPSMVLNYETETNKVMEVSVLDSENNIKSKKFETEKENEFDIEMLYDIEGKEYNWYKHEKKQDGTEIFTEIVQNDIEEGIDPTEDKIHQFTKEEMAKQNVTETENESISKFDEQFVKPDIGFNRTDIDLKNKDIDKKEVKEKVKEAVNNYKSQDQLVTEETKEKIDEKVKELETKKGEIQKAKEDKNKEVVGIWYLNNNINSSDSNITSLSDIFGSGLKMGDNTLTLKEDNTFEFYVGIAYNTTGNYEYKDEKITVYNITDSNYPNDLKSIEDNLKFEYITYNGKEFLKLHLWEFSNVDIYFERNPQDKSGNIAKDNIPGMTTNKTNENQSNENQGNTNKSNSATTKQETTTNSSSLKVGNYTLQYGKYKGTDSQYDLTGVVNWDVTIELKQDGTYIITSSNQQMQGNSSGTYKVGKLAGSDAIILDSGGGYGVLANNQLTVLAGSGTTFKYQG